ncbi:glutamate--cysteine ligase [Dehalobacter sp. DCM]|nr:glutamate--cysteine ligase [Dehalobacter sp. DCM]
MLWNFDEVRQLFAYNNKNRLLREGNFGLELESQRITASGQLALTPHPAQFGDKTINSRITTDFAESQVEMITPPYPSVREAYAALQAIWKEVDEGIGDELLWPLSMPPRLPDEDRIPIARFADTAYGRDKETYRRGLALRYGKKMQMISGIHYNFSLSHELLDYLYGEYGNPNTLSDSHACEDKNTVDQEKDRGRREFVDQIYFALARNFLRSRWLLIYLFGASPYCDSSYLSVIKKELEVIKKNCPCCREGIPDLYQYTTSLRVSRFGYSNTYQNRYSVFFNNLGEYTEKVREMLEQENPDYTRLGFRENNLPVQLNGNILQTESEFYSSIRVKQNVRKGETQLKALVERGVDYIEIRMLDLDPFEKVGISLSGLHFLQVFMMYCLFEHSDSITADELKQINANHHLTALYGRKNGLMLHRYDGKMISLREFGEKIFGKLAAIAGLMDKNTGNSLYRQSVRKEYAKLTDITRLPSSRIAREMMAHEESLLMFGLRQAAAHTEKYPDKNLDENSVAAFAPSFERNTYPYPRKVSCGEKRC